MEKYVIFPDVTCDVSKEMQEYFGLNDYIEGYVHINDKPLKTRLDWTNISRGEFYKTLGNKKNSVTSATASPEEYYQRFKKYVQDGYAVLSMSISSKISATFNVATAAAKRVVEEIPDAKIYCFDSLRMSGSFGLLVCYALEMQKEGKSFDEVVGWLEENKVCVHQMGPIDDLSFVARRGKISTGKAIMGNLIGIKPMGDSNSDGYVTVLAKVKGIKKALAASVKYMKKMARDIESQYVFILHSDRENYAMQLKELVENSVTCKKIFVGDVFSACGTNIGPGMISLYFIGEPISDECVVEKDALNSVIAEN